MSTTINHKRKHSTNHKSKKRAKIDILQTIYQESSKAYKRLVHNVLSKMVSDNLSSTDVINLLQEKHQQIHKWDKSLYKDMIQHIIPYLVMNPYLKMQTKRNTNDRHYNNKELVKLFRINKHWNTILKSYPLIWNSYINTSRMYVRIHDMLDTSIYNSKYPTLNCTPCLHISINESFTQSLPDFIQFTKSFKWLKSIYINLINIGYTQTTSQQEDIINGLIQFNTQVIQFLQIKKIYVTYNGSMINNFINSLLNTFNSIHSLDLYHVNTTIPYSLQPWMQQIKELEINMRNKNTEYYVLLLQSVSPLLESLIINEGYRIRIDDQRNTTISILKIIQSCIHLKHLSFDFSMDSYDDDDDDDLYQKNPFLEYLPKSLESIETDMDISMVSQIENYCAKHVSDHNDAIFSQLKSLHISRVTDDQLQYIPTVFPNIQHLILDECRVKNTNNLKLLQILPLQYLSIDAINVMCLTGSESDKNVYRISEHSTRRSIETFFQAIVTILHPLPKVELSYELLCVYG